MASTLYDATFSSRLYEPGDLFITGLITRSDPEPPLLKTRGVLRNRPRHLLIKT